MPDEIVTVALKRSEAEAALIVLKSWTGPTLTAERRLREALGTIAPPCPSTRYGRGCELDPGHPSLHRAEGYVW